MRECRSQNVKGRFKRKQINDFTQKAWSIAYKIKPKAKILK